MTYSEDEIAGVLREHYLMDVICDPANRRDNPVCGCSVVNLGWFGSVGGARQAWISHVLDRLRRQAAELPAQRAESPDGSTAGGRAHHQAGEAS